MKYNETIELHLVQLSNKEDQGDGSSSVLVGGRQVFQPLKLGGLVCQVFLHIVRYEYRMSCKLTCHKFHVLVLVNLELEKFVDCREVGIDKRFYEHLEIWLLECSFLLPCTLGHLLEV